MDLSHSVRICAISLRVTPCCYVQTTELMHSVCICAKFVACDASLLRTDHGVNAFGVHLCVFCACDALLFRTDHGVNAFGVHVCICCAFGALVLRANHEFNACGAHLCVCADQEFMHLVVFGVFWLCV